MKRLIVRVILMTGLFTALAVPASAQIVHSLTLGAGLFLPRGFDSRVEGDVLVANLTQPDELSLEFEIGDFKAYPIFGEWNIAFGDRIEVGAGVAYWNKKVTSHYRDLVDGHGTPTTADDTEIVQDLRLRAIPITGVVRFLPFGRAGGFQPYAGAGVTIVPFKYSETGQFVDPTDLAVFNDQYIATGTAVGGVILAGLRLPMGGDVYAFMIEGRYQFVSGNTGGAEAGFLGDKIDLSGGHLNFGFLIRF